MKKRTIAIIISVFVLLAVTVTYSAIRKGQEKTVQTENWIEKTIDKELMKTQADCGIASVKMLLDFYGKDVTYEELKQNINTTAEGTDWEDMKKYIQTIDNLEILEFEKNTGKAKEYLEKGYPLLICWNVDEEEEDSHYSILIAIGSNSVWMMDPSEKKSLSEYSLDYFLPCWKNADYWFCVLEEKNKKINDERITEIKTNDNSYNLNNQQGPDLISELISIFDVNEFEWHLAGIPLNDNNTIHTEAINVNINTVK